MITQELLKSVNHIVTHENCPDGMASAMILKDVLPDAKVTFCNYNTPLHMEIPAKPGMLFCDFVPHKDRIKEFVNVGTIVLDHHAKSKGIVEAFGELSVFADEDEEPGVAGANLAYREVWKQLASKFPSDDLLSFQEKAGIRDTWQKDNPKWKDACIQAEALIFYSPDYFLNDHPPFLIDEEIELGKILLQKKEDSIKNNIDKIYTFSPNDRLTCAIFQGGKLTSDLSECLRKEKNIDICAGFRFTCYENKPFVIFSCRSNKNFDVGSFCEALGGGGHTRAASFKMALEADSRPAGNGISENPYLAFEKCLKKYLL